jgi:hypothetical protein
MDGRMLCERHANANAARGFGEAGDGVVPTTADNKTWAPRSKATKRVTRFIDLAGGGLR